MNIWKISCYQQKIFRKDWVRTTKHKSKLQLTLQHIRVWTYSNSSFITSNQSKWKFNIIGNNINNNQANQDNSNTSYTFNLVNEGLSSNTNSANSNTNNERIPYNFIIKFNFMSFLPAQNITNSENFNQDNFWANFEFFKSE